MEWKDVPGYKWLYRVSDTGRVQKQLDNGDWYELRPYITGGRARAVVKMRRIDNKKIEVPLVWLVADAFMGGRKKGYCIVHKNGAKLDCAVTNLKFVTPSECGKMFGPYRRKPVKKIDKSGKVVAFYSSSREAARKNHMSENAMWNRVNCKLQNPYSLDGFDYRYDK